MRSLKEDGFGNARATFEVNCVRGDQSSRCKTDSRLITSALAPTSRCALPALYDFQYYDERKASRIFLLLVRLEIHCLGRHLQVNFNLLARSWRKNLLATVPPILLYRPEHSSFTLNLPADRSSRWRMLQRSPDMIRKLWLLPSTRRASRCIPIPSAVFLTRLPACIAASQPSAHTTLMSGELAVARQRLTEGGATRIVHSRQPARIQTLMAQHGAPRLLALITTKNTCSGEILLCLQRDRTETLR
jgi:hypothetical protein